MKKTDTRKQYEVKWLETESHKTYFGNEMDALAFAHFLEEVIGVIKIDVTQLTGDDCLIREDILILERRWNKMVANKYILDWKEDTKDKCAAFADLRDMIWFIRSIFDKKIVTEIKITIFDQDIQIFYIEKKAKLKDNIITKGGNKYVKESK